MIESYINKKYLNSNKIKLLKKEFVEAKPFNYLVLKDFFILDMIHKVADELQKENFSRQESDLFSFSQTNDLKLTNNNVLSGFYNFINSKEFKDYLFNITIIEALGIVDASGFIYYSGDYLLPHDDRLDSRKIAYVLNLSSGFSKSDGGSLDFFDGNKIFKSIVPSFNTLTLFRVVTNRTFHQVSEVLSEKSRISIAGWFND